MLTVVATHCIPVLCQKFLDSCGEPAYILYLNEDVMQADIRRIRHDYPNSKTIGQPYQVLAEPDVYQQIQKSRYGSLEGCFAQAPKEGEIC